MRAVTVPGPSPACSGVRPATAHAARTDTESNTMSMSKRAYQEWLDSLPPEELPDTDDYPHQDEPTEEELRALAAETRRIDPPPTDAELDAMAKQYGANRPDAVLNRFSRPVAAGRDFPQHTPREQHHEDATTTDGGAEAEGSGTA